MKLWPYGVHVKIYFVDSCVYFTKQHTLHFLWFDFLIKKRVIFKRYTGRGPHYRRLKIRNMVRNGKKKGYKNINIFTFLDSP